MVYLPSTAKPEGITYSSKQTARIAEKMGLFMGFLFSVFLKMGNQRSQNWQ